MAQIDIGKIKMVWKGAWDSSTAYTKDDAVSHSGSSYICIQDGTNQNPSTATAYWELLAQAGTNGTNGSNGSNGTDIGTTITTQGDLLYRDGSGLQRLAAGTAGNVLQTGGAGANPSWTAISSDCVKVASGNFPTNASELNIDNVFTSGTYDIYKVFFSNMNLSNGNNSMGVRLIRSDGNNHTQSNYTYIQTDHYRDSSSNNGPNPAGQWNETSWLFNNWHWSDNTSTGKRGAGEFTLFNPMESGVIPLMNYHIIEWEQNGNYFLNLVGTATLTTVDYTQFRGISFRSVGSHNFAGGTYAVYGFKQ